MDGIVAYISILGRIWGNQTGSEQVVIKLGKKEKNKYLTEILSYSGRNSQLDKSLDSALNLEGLDGK